MLTVRNKRHSWIAHEGNGGKAMAFSDQNETLKKKKSSRVKKEIIIILWHGAHTAFFCRTLQ